MNNNELANTQQQLAERLNEDNALSLLPSAEWIAPVGFFLATRNHLIKSRLALCASLKLWIARGLTLDEAKDIFRRLAAPENAQRHMFESELMADLAACVAVAERRRRVAEDADKRKQSHAGARVACNLADAFRAPWRPG